MVSPPVQSSHEVTRGGAGLRQERVVADRKNRSLSCGAMWLVSSVVLITGSYLLNLLVCFVLSSFDSTREEGINLDQLLRFVRCEGNRVDPNDLETSNDQITSIDSNPSSFLIHLLFFVKRLRRRTYQYLIAA